MPPSVRDYNQTPFWDFIESLQEQGSAHPFFENMNNATNNNTDSQDGAQDAYHQHQGANPWSQGWSGFPFGPMPHRGRHGRHGPPPSPGQEHGRHGPGGPHGPGPRGPPPPGHEHAWHGPHGPGPHGPPPPPGYEHGGRPGRHGSPPPPGHEHAGPADNDMKPTSEEDNDPEEVVLGEDGLPQETETCSGACGPGGRHHGRRAHGGLRHGGRGSPHHAGHEGPRGGGRGRGGWGGRGRGGPFGHRGLDTPMAGGFGALASLLQDQFFGGEASSSTDKKDKAEEDFKPEVDVFDTTDSFIVHISLPGAKKEDVGVHWDAEKSELNVAGVIHRPGDEDLLKTLALDERKVGAFARKVRLGSRANPAQVDVDGISAKLEDGILRVDVPKLDSGYVEIKKVDIE